MAAEIPDGAVLVARGILNSSLWTMRPDDRIVAITCIALCNSKPKKWWDGSRELVIQRGQFVRSREQMVRACQLPLQRVRTSVQHLENSAFLTRCAHKMYTLYTLPKYDHYQDLTKYSDSVICQANPVSNPQPTRNQPAPNHKQQQQTYPTSLNNRRTGSGNGVAVVVDPATWADQILAKPSLRVSLKLLESVKMAASVAHAFAASKPVGLVLRVVQQARYQRKPGGWARMALENDWWLPEAEGKELLEVIDLMKAEAQRVSATFVPKILKGNQRLPDRAPGEDERTYFNRVNDDLKRRRAQTNSGGQKARKGSHDHP